MSKDIEVRSINEIVNLLGKKPLPNILKITPTDNSCGWKQF